MEGKKEFLHGVEFACTTSEIYFDFNNFLAHSLRAWFSSFLSLVFRVRFPFAFNTPTHFYFFKIVENFNAHTAHDSFFLYCTRHHVVAMNQWKKENSVLRSTQKSYFYSWLVTFRRSWSLEGNNGDCKARIIGCASKGLMFYQQKGQRLNKDRNCRTSLTNWKKLQKVADKLKQCIHYKHRF